MILEFFPHARVYCFEPLPDPFEKLSQWADSQQGRVKVFNTALGENEGSAEMFCHLEHSPSSSVLETTSLNEEYYPFTKVKKRFPVRMASLDKTVANFPENLMPDLLIKLDVQGFEDRVIKGGPETFRRAKACILEVNLDALYAKQATFKDVLLLLYDLGFRYAGNLNQVYSPDDGHVIYLDALFLKE